MLHIFIAFHIWRLYCVISLAAYVFVVGVGCMIAGMSEIFWYFYSMKQFTWFTFSYFKRCVAQLTQGMKHAFFFLRNILVVYWVKQLPELSLSHTGWVHNNQPWTAHPWPLDHCYTRSYEDQKPSDHGMDNKWVHNSVHLPNLLYNGKLFEFAHIKTLKPAFPLNSAPEAV